MTNPEPSSRGRTARVTDGPVSSRSPDGAAAKANGAAAKAKGVGEFTHPGPDSRRPGSPPHFPDERDGCALFGLVSFDGPERCASSVLVPFATAVDADRYAVTHGLADYVVAPLSFLATR